ncbi:MAG TPA: DUF1501 domain-containing protein [Planctomycetota bacterium]|nr:DUF1501 domain-containing protein [Planctomycetota bacterium]
MSCNRRDFLKGMAACFAGGVMGRGGGIFKLRGTHVSFSAAPRGMPGGNIVVFVQLSGGNDGINMVYPLNGKQRSNYEMARPTLALPIDTTTMQPWVDAKIGGTAVLDIGQNVDGNNYAFNPAMGALHNLFTQGKLAVLPGVHYPAANHSHFESTNIYTSADPSGNNADGWFGKFLNLDSGYSASDVPTVIMGDSQSPLFTPSVPGIFTFSNLDALQFPANDDGQLKAMIFNDYCAMASGRDGNAFPEMVKIAQTAHATVTHLTEFYNPAGADGMLIPAKVQALLLDKDGNYSRDNPLIYSSPLNTDVNPAIQGNDLATDLKHVAAIIRADVGARFFHVTIGGFDTHSEQEKGLYHSSLLNQLSEALAAFYAELGQAVTLPAALTGYQTGDLTNNVALVSFSEFGRTITQNATDPNKAGTDHAASAPQLVLGGKVLGGQYGVYPQLDDPGAEAQDDLKLTTDFRDVFGTMLDKWLNVPVADLGPGTGKILTPTSVADQDGNSYTAYTPLGFL